MDKTHARNAREDSDKVFDLTMELVLHTKSLTTSIAEEYGLSLPQVHALQLLDVDSSAPMRELATSMHCDPSNITGITDRLETMGLAERRPSAEDRRVKTIALTDKGRQVRREMMARISTSIAPVANLDPAQQRLFCELLSRALHGPTEIHDQNQQDR